MDAMLEVISTEGGGELQLTKHAAKRLKPWIKKELLFYIWVFSHVGTVPSDVILKIYSYVLDPVDAKIRGCVATLHACSYLSRFWVKNNDEKWGSALIRQVLPSLENRLSACEITDISSIGLCSSLRSYYGVLFENALGVPRQS